MLLLVPDHPLRDLVDLATDLPRRLVLLHLLLLQGLEVLVRDLFILSLPRRVHVSVVKGSLPR